MPGRVAWRKSVRFLTVRVDMIRRRPRKGHVLAAAVAALALAAPQAQAATYPQGFSERTVFSGLTNPTAVRFASDGRVFVAEKSGLIKVFDSLSDAQPDVFADLRTQVHNFWDRGLLGLALDPDFPAEPVRVRAVRARRGDRRHRAALGHGGRDVRRMPDSARRDRGRLRGQRASLAPDRVGQRDGRLRAGADRGLVPAVSEPLDRRARLRAGRRAVRVRRRRRELQLRRLRPGRQPGQPVRGSARRCRRAAHPADGRGRRAPQPGPAHVRRRDFARRGAAARRPGDRRRPARQSERGQPRSQRAADRRVRPAQPVPDRRAPRHRRGVGRGRGLEHVGGDPAPPEPDRRRGQLRLALLRGRRPPGRLRLREPVDLREPLRRRPVGRAGAAVRLEPQRDRSCPARACPTGSSSAAGIAFAPTDGPYPSEYRGALFFADYSRDCIWAMLPGANGVPDPARIRTFAATAANPVYLQTGPGGDLFYADFDGGTIRRVSFTAANQPPTAVATAQPDDRQRPADRPVRRLGLERPGRGRQPHLRLGPRRRRPARRLHRRVPEPHLHEPGRLHRRACASPTAHGATGARPSRSTSATRRPRRPSPRPRPAPPGASAT